MRTSFDIKSWEYLWYFFVTVFLLVAGLVLLVLAGVRWIFNGFRRPLFSIRNIVLMAIVAGMVTFGVIYLEFIHDKDLGQRAVTVTVLTGDRFNTVAQHLADSGVVRSKLLLTYPARLMKIDTRLIPGRYLFTGENSAKSVLEKFARGEIMQVRVTIPEGLPIWRVASILKTHLETDSVTLMKLNTDRSFLDSLGLPYLEGYLFPETYQFSPGTDSRTVAREMVRMFREKTDSLWTTSMPNGLTRDETVILASIVEAETPLDTEKPRVAAVYLNRLRIGMALDADPTVIYGLGGLERVLTRDDLEKQTRYNTYQSRGLPPTPINSPGLSSLVAAVRPENSAYLFFVADGTGSGAHIFSYTNEEHNTARKKAKLAERMLQRQ